MHDVDREQVYQQAYMSQNELSYPSDHEQEVFQTSVMAWSPEERKQQIQLQHYQQQQHMLQQLQQQHQQQQQSQQSPPQLTIQTHSISDVDRLKCLSLYSAGGTQSPNSIHSPVPSHPSLQAQNRSTHPHPIMEPSELDEWHRAQHQHQQEHQDYHAQQQAYLASGHQSVQSDPRVKQEESQQVVYAPMTQYPHASQQHLNYYDMSASQLPQVHMAQHHGAYSQIPAVNGYYEHQGPHHGVHATEMSPSNSSPVVSPSIIGHYVESHQQQLACDPRYVSCEPESYTSRERHISPEFEVYEKLQRQSQARLRSHSTSGSEHEVAAVVDEDRDAEGEEDFDATLSNTAGVSPISGPQSSNPSEDEDEEYDPEDPMDGEYVYRQRRRNSVPFITTDDEGRSIRLRSSTTVRYNPYPYSPTSEYSPDTTPLATRSRRTVSNATAASVSSSSSTSSSSSYFPPTPTSPVESSRRRPRPASSIPLPVPIPNLTKKSRGRRVPTVQNLEYGRGPAHPRYGLDNGEWGNDGNPVSTIGGASSITGGRRGAAKGVRMFTCKVPGCGKCFARGEHLKRHVRSIHTYEKPHRCPYPGCGKDFSRHDNLNQHMRVHKDWVPPPKAPAADEYRA